MAKPAPKGAAGAGHAAPAALEALRHPVVLLDRRGFVARANAAWAEAGAALGPAGAGHEHGDYLEACARAAAAGRVEAGRIAQGLREVLGGREDFFEAEYECPDPGRELWCKLSARPWPVGDALGALVQHQDVSARRAAERRERLTFALAAVALAEAPPWAALAERCLVVGRELGWSGAEAWCPGADGALRRADEWPSLTSARLDAVPDAVARAWASGLPCWAPPNEARGAGAAPSTEARGAR
ncbi:MAG TPA: PAS domain-containing protein, partial [Polyangiaceae bacterium]|nr:PAS domain-containing protein [Polyangiaceae bacterium]